MFKTPLMHEPVVQSDAPFTVTECELGWRRPVPPDDTANRAEYPFRSISMKSNRALVRAKPTPGGSAIPHVLCIVSGTYKLVQNYELYTHLEEILRNKLSADQLKGVKIRDHGAYHGQITWREYQFPNVAGFVKSKGDVTYTGSNIAFRMIVKNGYGKSSLRLFYGAIDAFCTNGMIHGSYDTEYFRHTSGLVIGDIGSQLDESLEQFDNHTRELNVWANTPIKNEEALDLLKKIATSPQLYNHLSNTWMEEAETRGSNKWALYSALTYYASHDKGVFKTRDTGNDASYATLHGRETNVAKWIESKEFVELGQ